MSYSFSLSFSLTHVANEHIDHPDTTPTVAGTQLKSRVARSTRFVRLRVLFAPPSSPLDPTDTMRFEQDRPICSSESGIRTCDNPKYGCFSANRSYRTLLHASLRMVSRIGNLLSLFSERFLFLFHSYIRVSSLRNIISRFKIVIIIKNIYFVLNMIITYIRRIYILCSK